MIITLAASCSSDHSPLRILVFTKTAGFRHIEAIDAGRAALEKLAAAHGVTVDTTEDAGKFNDENLKRYNAVVFLNVSGEVFNTDEQYAFQRYIEAGGGYLGIHGTSDAEREWPWFGRLTGAYFNSHPPGVRKGTFVVEDRTNEATDSLPVHWTREDEFYNFQQVDSTIKVLIDIDEHSYEGGNMGAHHPMVWYHDFDGGRSFYISMGHTPETYSEPLFLKLLWGGLDYAIDGDKPVKLDYSKVIPEENRFSIHVLMEKLDEPMEMAFSDNGRQIFFAQRRGSIVCYDNARKRGEVIGTIPVSSKYEDGLLGMAADPHFSQNKWLYVFYTAPAATEFRVSRFTVGDSGSLDLASEKILLKIPKEILDGSHTGGGLLFDPRGTGDLYITVGDNTSPRATTFGPFDERDGRMIFDAQRSASNTNDLRGKILRIHPEKNGTYTIPEGNLFKKGTPKTRPEIYTMGHRQPWRISMDTKTGWLYEGEVGPDADADSVGRGSMGFDEFNIIRKPGFYGWPYFIGNKPYVQYDFATGESGTFFDPAKPENHSRYNTGLTELPPAQSATVWYPNFISSLFPLTGTGARCAVGGPVFRKENFKDAANRFPDYYEGKWFVTDWIRGWILVVTTGEDGSYQSMEPFMPSYRFSSPLDMQFGPDGSLYVLEYGSGWFQANDDARLVRVDYNGGNRAPVVEAGADIQAAAVPFTTTFSGMGSFDHDAGDELSYEWVVTTNGKVFSRRKGQNMAVTFNTPGIYEATLTVKDNHGATATSTIEVKAGNEPAAVKPVITRGNKTFFFPNTTIGYAVTIRDKEDGVIEKDSSILVSVRYLPDGYNEAETDNKEMHGAQQEDFSNLPAQLMINGNDCYSCHAIDKKSAGPSFRQVADRYENDPGAPARLINKIIQGGSGNWGDRAMSAHPDLNREDAKVIVGYILSMSGKAKKPVSLPLSGNYAIGAIPADKGAVVLQAAYTDRGNAGIPPITSRSVVVLRSPLLMPDQADVTRGMMSFKTVNPVAKVYMMSGQPAYLGYRDIDLSGIGAIRIGIAAPAEGTFVEVHIDRPDGPIIGETKPAGKPGDAAVSEEVRIKRAEGLHDIYFVSRKLHQQQGDYLLNYTGFLFEK